MSFQNAAASSCEDPSPNIGEPDSYRTHSGYCRMSDRPDGTDWNLGSAPEGRGASRPDLPHGSVSRSHRRSRGRHVGPDPVVRWRSQRQRLLRFGAGAPWHEDGSVRSGLAYERPDAASLGGRVCEAAVRVYVQCVGCVAEATLVVVA